MVRQNFGPESSVIPDLQIVTEKVLEPKRIVPKDVTAERLESSRESVIDFCKRSRSFTQPMHFWAYVNRVLKGHDQADLWWVLDGDEVVSFLIVKVYQDFDGGWTAYAMFGYSKSNAGCNQWNAILEDYKHKGVTRFQFTTVRNPRVFQRWLGKDWKPTGTLFQARY